MGFLGSLKRIVQGEPVYQPQDFDNARNPGNTHPIQAAAMPGPMAAKTIPNVRIRRVEFHVSGQRADVYADLRNESADTLTLDKILLLGTRRELNTALRAGETRQFVVYSGPLLVHQPGGYAEVQYRKQDGDYFASFHTIRSAREPDGSWRITEFLQSQPVKDM